MNNAWETTTDDVLNVIHSIGKKATGDKVQEILDNLDQFSIEDAALNGDSMDEQTKYAYEEIKNQITKENLL